MTRRKWKLFEQIMNFLWCWCTGPRLPASKASPSSVVDSPGSWKGMLQAHTSACYAQCDCHSYVVQATHVISTMPTVPPFMTPLPVITFTLYNKLSDYQSALII